MSRRQREATDTGNLVLPGQILDTNNTSAPGIGARQCESSDQLRATILGTPSTTATTINVKPLRITSTTTPNQKEDNNQQQHQQQQEETTSDSTTLDVAAPSAGSTVLFRVTKVLSNAIAGPIIAVNGNKWCLPTFRGIVRLDDIRAVTAKEHAAGLVPTHASASYRLGDIVVADVISLTEARQFQLTTQPPHCGCIKVFSERKVDGVYGRVPGRRDQITVEDDDTGVTRTVSKWVPAASALKE